MRSIAIIVALSTTLGCTTYEPKAVEPEPAPESPAAEGAASVGERQPANLMEAIDIAEGWLREGDNVETFRDGDPIMYHHGFGTHMRNSWGLWGDSELAQWFRERGVEHPDDMSMVVLEGLHRRVNGEEVREEELMPGATNE